MGYRWEIDYPPFLRDECERIAISPEMLFGWLETSLGSVSALQIGANDGEQHDFLGKFLDRPNWRGVLVEADPLIYPRLVLNNRHREKRIVTLNVAVGDGNVTEFFSVDFSGDHQLPAWAEGLGSFNKETLLAHVPVAPAIKERIYSRKLATVSVNEIIREHFDGPPDVIVMDVEGYEKVLIPQIDLGKRPPLMIIYESRHMSRREHSEIIRHLGRHGYMVTPGGQDSYAVHRSFALTH
jgi:FkbM family methyltransferase